MTDNKAKEFTVIFEETKVAMLDYHVTRWIDRRIQQLMDTGVKVQHQYGLTYKLKYPIRKRSTTVERYFMNTCEANVTHPHDRIVYKVKTDRFEGWTPEEILQWKKDDEEFHKRMAEINKEIEESHQKERLLNYSLQKLYHELK